MFVAGQTGDTFVTTMSDKNHTSGPPYTENVRGHTQPVCQQVIQLASLTGGLWVIVTSDYLTRALRKQTGCGEAGEWLG